MVPQISTINEIESLDPCLALMYNPIVTGNKNNNRKISNRKLNARVVNPVRNSDVLISITLP